MDPLERKLFGKDERCFDLLLSTNVEMENDRMARNGISPLDNKSNE
jgi:hypothetical protein